MSVIASIQAWLDKRRIELADDVLKLSEADAPKLKFSIITGKIKMIDEVKSEIETQLRDSERTNS
jgi:hypothetical protein